MGKYNWESMEEVKKDNMFFIRVVGAFAVWILLAYEVLR